MGTGESRAFAVHGIPADIDQVDAAMLRSRLISAATGFEIAHPGDLTLTVTNQAWSPDKHDDQPTADERAAYFRAEEPLYQLDFLVVPQETRDQIDLAVHRVRRREHLHTTWGLRRIDPVFGTATNLHGPPGTGKTLAAHDIAAQLGRPLIKAKYSQLESKYHGEGPKNLDALFRAAVRDNAVLFIDEADSLLSRRFEVTSHGSEEAVNAMRNELIQAIDTFPGLVIFASNLTTSYDTAFDTRLTHIRFGLPDRAARAAIWRAHLPSELPMTSDVDVDALAEREGVTGREIRRAVIDAATRADRAGRDRVCQQDLHTAIDRIRTAAQEARAATAKPVDPDSKFGRTIQEAASRALGHTNGHSSEANEES